MTFVLSCQVGILCVCHIIPMLRNTAFPEYCAVAFIYWFCSQLCLLTIHSSHLYQSVRDIQMLVPRYLRRSEWLLVSSGTIYIYTGRVYCILLRKVVILADPTGVVNWEYTRTQGKILLLPFTLK